jgi:adenine phosphoribosyltransferase
MSNIVHQVFSPAMDLKQHIRSVPDFPKPGIMFYDIGTLLAHGEAWRTAMDRLAEAIAPLKPDALVGIESRGFLVAAPLAAMLGIGFVMVRKKGKLPGKTIPHSYALEYGTDTIEIQEGMLKQGQGVVLCDDLLATGGTAAAATSLVRRIGAEVIHAAFIIELSFLDGRRKLGVPVTSLMNYDH